MMPAPYIAGGHSTHPYGASRMPMYDPSRHQSPEMFWPGMFWPGASMRRTPLRVPRSATDEHQVFQQAGFWTPLHHLTIEEHQVFQQAASWTQSHNVTTEGHQVFQQAPFWTPSHNVTTEEHQELEQAEIRMASRNLSTEEDLELEQAKLRTALHKLSTEEGPEMEQVECRAPLHESPTEEQELEQAESGTPSHNLSTEEHQEFEQEDTNKSAELIPALTGHPAIRPPPGVFHAPEDYDSGTVVRNVVHSSPPGHPHPSDNDTQDEPVSYGSMDPPPGLSHPAAVLDQDEPAGAAGAMEWPPGPPHPSDDDHRDEQRPCGNADVDIFVPASAVAQPPWMSHRSHFDDSDDTTSVADSCDFSPEVFVGPTQTTMMIRNLPKFMTQQQLIARLDESGFGLWYDFVYMPANIQTHATHGFAFVNFLSPDIADMFKNDWHMSFRFGEKQKRPLDVCASSVQGLEANFARWAKGKTRRLRDERFAPLIFREDFQ